MKNIKSIFVFLLFIGLISSTSFVSALTSSPLVINQEGQVSSGGRYQVTGTVSSIADISNGNLKANLLVNSGMTPYQVKAKMLDGALQVGYGFCKHILYLQ